MVLTREEEVEGWLSCLRLIRRRGKQAWSQETAGDHPARSVITREEVSLILQSTNHAGHL